MRNRLFMKVNQAKRTRQKLFCAFLTAGYPNLKMTETLITEFEKAGVDIIELGFPFSDPLADGKTIQYASQAALKKGIRMEDAFNLVQDLRRKGVRIPILFFSYFNPIFHYGSKKFVHRAKEIGLDGMVVPDLPPDEEKLLGKECARQKFAQIYLVAPTTDRKRAQKIVRASKGFIYYVSLKGVTGARRVIPTDLKKHLGEIRAMTGKSVLVGFGVSTPHQAHEISKMSDGVIVGSAIIDRLRRSKNKVAETVRFVRAMTRAVKGHS